MSAFLGIYMFSEFHVVNKVWLLYNTEGVHSVCWNYSVLVDTNLPLGSDNKPLGGLRFCVSVVRPGLFTVLTTITLTTKNQ